MSITGNQDKLYSILSSIAEDYVCFIEVDLATEKEIRFLVDQETGGLSEWVEEDDYSVCIGAFADSIVSEEDRERFRDATSLKRLKNYFRYHDEYVIEYDVFLGEKLKHYQGHFVLSGNPDDTWEKKKLHIGIRDITESRIIEDKSRQQASWARMEHGTSAAGRKHILIYGDKREYAEIISLLENDYRFQIASDMEQFKDILEESGNIISLFLVDADLTDGRVDHLFKLIRQDFEITAVPAVILRTDITPSEEEEYLKHGSSGVVRKPFRNIVIQGRIQSIMKMSDAISALSRVGVDTLTGLKTQEAFMYQVENILNHNPDKSYSIVVADILGFRMIRSLYGEKVANDVVMTIAGFLKRMEANGVVAGKYKEDVFVALIETVPELASQISDAEYEKMVDSLMPIRGVAIKYGLYENIDTSLSVSQLVNRAVIALESVKSKYGQNIGLYSEELQQENDKRHRIEMTMTDAYYNDQFKVFYQPKHDAVTGGLVGAEALVRWEHPEFGMLSPGEFVPIFEQNGFISYVDFYAWKRSCMNLRKWMDEGIDVVPISVNSSGMDFQWNGYLEQILQPVNEYDIDPSLLHIEITESAVSPRIDQMVHDLQVCRDAGFKIELDDYGSGYSAVSMLAKLPIDVVKMDKSIVENIDDERRAKVLAASISLAKSLGYSTIGEGVESESQLEQIRSIGCDAVQGYLFSPPMPEDEFREYMINAKNIEIETGKHELSKDGSLMYCIDSDYNVIGLTNEITDMYPDLEIGRKCHKCLMDLDEPCPMCPVKNKIVGPQVYLDPIRKVYEKVEAISLTTEDGRSGSALILSSMN